MAEEFTDEYFINLTMDFDKRDDTIYPKWAVWCAKSGDKYFIDGKDGHFFTHERTNEEIAIEKKKRMIIEFSFKQERELTEEGRPTEKWMGYESYLHELMMDKDNILQVKPKTFEQWKKEN